MARPLALSAASVLLGILTVLFVFLGFFTNSWLIVKSDELMTSATENGNLDESQSGDFNQKERLSTTPSGTYGLFDHGLSDLNCEAIPFPICMYTRAGVFSSILVLIPSIVLTVLSAAIMSSGGSLASCGSLARAGGTCFLLSTIGGCIGMIVFTLQQTSCLTNCPDEGLTYYPRMEQNRVEFAWSFYISWAGQIISFVQVFLMYAIALTSAKEVKEQYIKDRQMAYNNNLNDAGIKMQSQQQVWG